ncbi:shikimate dehydrogenase [Helicobacter sp. 11S03491-1]|uniref:shikimate dehydrogenase n=1 Tax=Helicobacter sp. 11S03491-1 TaxID=1476196 RepID=UPI000BA5E02B|nr:shikimate dehydrogenase [Helicobacter sp. 11S03491-1]PAF42040.1 shikimate dehydrogenase [Helicobacter sp. 11S03491-1]
MRQFCVFGNPIAHSKSPLIHNFVFSSFSSQIGFEGFYGQYLLEDGEKLRQTFYQLELSGANITVPFKEYAYTQSDEVKGIGSRIGSVNTWVLEDNHRLIGYNTDAEGFYQTILDYNFQTALIIGAGGSAKAVAYILKEKGIKVCILNRSKNHLESFIQNGFECYLSDVFMPRAFDLVINATPAGLKDTGLPLQEMLLRQILLDAKMAYDLIYGISTPFLKLAKELNILSRDGKDMLIEQAALAFELFCKHKIPLESIRKQMKLIL